MRRALFAFVCAMFLLISSTSPGNAFSLWGGGGGGHGGGGGPAVPSSVFQFDFHDLQYRGEIDFQGYLADYKGPDYIAPDWKPEIKVDGWGIEWPAPNSPTNGGSIPVPEAATMVLLGAGLTGLATYGRKRVL